MAHRDGFWKLEHLSDTQLLESLSSVLRRQHITLSELVAHLAEVEERRLHLEAAYPSMFSYCVACLGMSEDEACRRIELARLARRFPALFAELASGQITLSVALVLKAVLSESNHRELLSATRGKSIRQAREFVAERFPKPDAPSSIRKLPEPRPAQASNSAKTHSPAPSSEACPLFSVAATPLASPATAPHDHVLSFAGARKAGSSPVPSLRAVSTQPAAPTSTLPAPVPASLQAALLARAEESRSPSPAPRKSAAPPASRNTIEPLSAGHYRIQFTADAALKQQLEQARDLLRHASPSGDFAPIISRALELLIRDLLRSRFGAGARRKVACRAPKKSANESSLTPEAATGLAVTPPPPVTPPLTVAPPPTVTPPSAQTLPAPTPRTPHIRRPARREVLERDGLGCSWTNAHGVRCGSQAWLEHDHRHPAGKGGSTDAENVRLLCRAHNQLAAEHAYGREHMERARRRQKAKHSPGPPT